MDLSNHYLGSGLNYSKLFGIFRFDILISSLGLNIKPVSLMKITANLITSQVARFIQQFIEMSLRILS